MQIKVYYFLLVLLIFFVFACKDDPTSSDDENTAPTASFTINLNSGTTFTSFVFDASGCSDIEDSISVLQVRWDWENDGNWDTQYSMTKTESHIYAMAGIYTVKLEVKDTGELINSTTLQISVTGFETGTVTDIDGNVYQTVKIGNQWWMVENLKVTHYRNGDAIPNITDSLTWVGLTTGAYCNYNNDLNYVATYGRLYNWYAVDDNRNIAPVGWHVSSDDDWKEMEMYLGMNQAQANLTGYRGTDEGGKMKTTGTIQDGDGLWISPNIGATNSCGFSAIPAGDYIGRFRGMGIWPIFWSSTENNFYQAWARFLYHNSTQVYRWDYYKHVGYSVRCIQD